MSTELRVRISNLFYDSRVLINVRRPIKVFIHNDTSLFPLKVEFRPILYYQLNNNWYPEGYGNPLSGLQRCHTGGWEFGAFRTRPMTITYKIDAMARRPPDIPEWMINDTRTFVITYQKPPGGPGPPPALY